MENDNTLFYAILLGIIDKKYVNIKLLKLCQNVEDYNYLEEMQLTDNEFEMLKRYFK